MREYFSLSTVHRNKCCFNYFLQEHFNAHLSRLNSAQSNEKKAKNNIGFYFPVFRVYVQKYRTLKKLETDN